MDNTSCRCSLQLATRLIKSESHSGSLTGKALPDCYVHNLHTHPPGAHPVLGCGVGTGGGGVGGTCILHCQLRGHLLDPVLLCLMGKAALMGGVDLALARPPPIALALFPGLLGLLLQSVLLHWKAQANAPAACNVCKGACWSF